MEQRNSQKEHGVTLVALVITIIVLLILAGVAVTTLSGKDNIIVKAKQARDEYNEVRANEEVILSSHSTELAKYGEQSGGAGTSPWKSSPINLDLTKCVIGKTYEFTIESSSIDMEVTLTEEGEAIINVNGSNMTLTHEQLVGYANAAPQAGLANGDTFSWMLGEGNYATVKFNGQNATLYWRSSTLGGTDGTSASNT